MPLDVPIDHITKSDHKVNQRASHSSVETIRFIPALKSKRDRIPKELIIARANPIKASTEAIYNINKYNKKEKLRMLIIEKMRYW